MVTNLKEITFSVTPSMEVDLDAAKKEYYYEGTQNDMINDLISRGLQAMKVETEIHIVNKL